MMLIPCQQNMGVHEQRQQEGLGWLQDSKLRDFFKKDFIFLSNLSTQHGAQTHNPNKDSQ